MIRRTIPIVEISIAATLVVSSCLPVYRNTERELAAYAQAEDDDNVVDVRFLGVGGFLIRRGDDAFLTAPLYSNPRASDLLDPIAPNTDRIERFHPQTPNVRAIFVGHAHYDHLMDVPAVWQTTADAMIYGNVSTKNILAGYGPNASVPVEAPRIPMDNVLAVNSPTDNIVDYRMCLDREGFPDNASIEGRWERVPGTRVRFRALCSEHPPQIARTVHLWPGGVLRPRFRPPDMPENFREGETHAFLIDFMNAAGTEPEFRIYYQDAPTNEPIGGVHESLIADDDKPVDLALLCVGNFRDVDKPTHIVANTNARYIILGHWENFFRPQDEKLKALPGTGKTVKQVKNAAPRAEVYLPAPQTRFQFWPAGVTQMDRN